MIPGTQKINPRRVRMNLLMSTSAIYKRMLRLLFFFLLTVTTHSLFMVYFESLNFFDALWLSLTTITTVGYGDFSASTVPGRIVTTVLIYGYGIFLLAQIVGEYLEYRIEVRQRKIYGSWRWKNMKQHLLIINTPNRDTERYLVRLCQQIRETHSMAQVPIQLLTREFSDGLPRSLRELGVVHYAADTELVSNYQACNIEHAKYVFLMAQDDWAHYSDSLTFDILDKISSLNISAHIVAEVVNDENRERFMRMGVQAVIRPVRVYPEIAVRAMSAPGTETVLEDMFTHEGAHPIRLNLDLTSIAWDDFACTVIKHGFGIPLGYIDQANKVITNPAATELVFAKAVLLLANNHRVPTEAELLNCVADL